MGVRSPGKCGKQTYPTLKVALKSARALYRKRGHFLTAYECTECGKFHLSSEFFRMRNWRR